MDWDFTSEIFLEISVTALTAGNLKRSCYNLFVERSMFKSDVIVSTLRDFLDAAKILYTNESNANV